jgi:hypothetical protein
MKLGSSLNLETETMPGAEFKDRLLLFSQPPIPELGL